MIRQGFIFFLLLMTVLVSAAQETKDVINIRQRLLQRKPQEMQELVDSFHQLHLMIAGNVYQTEKHVNYAYDPANGKYDFTNEFKYVQPLLNLGDISIVNLKTSFGNDSSDMFSSPDEFALTLKYAGINGVMHANMHTANIHKSTLKRTRDVLNQYDMYHTGAFIDQAERTGNYPLIINKKGFRIAVLNYTKLPSRPQVSREFVINEADKSGIDRDMRMAQAYKPDFIIVYFDWSDNFQDIPTPTEQGLAHYAFEKGADLVVGTCPNVPMRIDHINYFYKGVAREGMVAYSLGNLLASSEDVKNCRGYMIDMDLRKNRFNNQTQISDWGIVPVYTYYDTTSMPGKTKVYSVPCWAIESGDIFPGIPYIEKRRVVNGAYQIRQMLGPNADELQYNLNELIVNNVKETIQITSAPLNNKYSQARASDIIPSAAPAVPLDADPKSATSLNKVYEESSAGEVLTQVGGADKNKTAANGKDKKKARDNFSGNTLNNEQPKSLNAGGGKVTNNEFPATAGSAGANAGKPDTATNADVNTKISAGNKPAATSNEKTVTESGANQVKTIDKNKSANTNYHTTGKEYNLKDANYASGNKKPTAPEPNIKKKETASGITTAGANGVVTEVNAEIQPELSTGKIADLKPVSDTCYRIQFYALKVYVPMDTSYYTHLKGYEVYEESGMFKYVLGNYKTYEACYNFWKEQIQPRYKQSFIVKFINGKRALK